MKTTKTTATITLLVAAAIAMAACTPTTPTDPTGSATASPTTSESPSPTATAGAAPVQDPVPAPTTQQEAITSATKAIENYLVASFAVDENPDLGVEYLRGFLVQGGAEQKVISDTVAHNLENGWHKTGSPTTWTTNDAMSYASQTTNAATGKSSSLELQSSTAAEITRAGTSRSQQARPLLRSRRVLSRASGPWSTSRTSTSGWSRSRCL